LHHYYGWHKVTKTITGKSKILIVAINETIGKNYTEMIKIEHLGIAVKDLSKSIELFEQLLSTPCYKTEEVASEAVKTAFFQIGESKIELLEASNEQSAISKFIVKKGEGLHHVAFEVDDIEAEMRRLSALGFELLNEQPKKGADNKLVCFVHPKTTNGVLVELCQEQPHPTAEPHP